MIDPEHDPVVLIMKLLMLFIVLYFIYTMATAGFVH